MDRPAASRPVVSPSRERALLARLAELGDCAGFEWLPAHGELLWNAAASALHGRDAQAPATLAEMLLLYDAPSQIEMQTALDHLTTGPVTDEAIELVMVGENARRFDLHMQREQFIEGAVRITGLFRTARAERPDALPVLDAHIDVLTGLLNRRGLQALAGEALLAAQHLHRPLAVLFIDLDRFKRVNDTLGHHAGDELLRVVARRLRTCVRGSDLVARQSGDEFVVVLTEVQRPQDAALVAQKVLDSLLRPATVVGQAVEIGCSIGIALLSQTCADMPALMRAADTAMYAAKDGGRNTYRFYTDAYFLRLQRRSELEQELRRALARDELFLVYQPSVSLVDGRPASIEALLRWRGPDGELRAPAEFVPLAEESGDIVPIGLWVLQQACRQARAWSDQGLGFDRLVINVAAQQLRDPEFPVQVLAICADSGWPPSRLELELTDAALVADREASRRVLGAVQAHGVSVSLDDFGTGLSNLIYLHRFQIRTLKLDRHFALGMQDDPALQEVLQAVIAMGHALRLRMVAKGVESAYAVDFLTERGCNEAQGFYFARPMPAADVPLWAQTRDLAQLTLLR